MALVSAVATASCGGAPPPPAATPAPVAEPEAHSEPEAAAAEPSPVPAALRSLAARLAPPPEGSPPTPAMGDALSLCPDPTSDECEIWSAGAYDGDAGRWLVLSVDWGEGAPEHLWLGLVSSASSEALVDARLDEASAGALARAIGTRRSLVERPSLVRQVALDSFGLGEYAPLVSLDPPLDGWLLYLEASGSEGSEYVLHLVRLDEPEGVVLGRRRARVGPCDGGGYWCEEPPPGGPCDAEGLRREGRLCVEPVHITFVALAPDGSSLLVLGYNQVGGHGGYPSFRWVVDLPAPVRRRLGATAAH